MKLNITIKPDPIVEFDSDEDMQRWLDRHPRPKPTMEDWRKVFETIIAERKRNATNH